MSDRQMISSCINMHERVPDDVKEIFKQRNREATMSKVLTEILKYPNYQEMYFVINFREETLLRNPFWVGPIDKSDIRPGTYPGEDKFGSQDHIVRIRYRVSMVEDVKILGYEEMRAPALLRSATQEIKYRARRWIERKAQPVTSLLSRAATYIGLSKGDPK